MKPVHAVVLAAGQGTRMRSARPKVLHAVAATPMLGHVLAAANRAGATTTHVVLGHGADMVRGWLEKSGYAVDVVLQSEQLGTAHAVSQAMPRIPDDAVVVVLCGDVPLIGVDIVGALIEAAEGRLALVTTRLTQPFGYGRILRDEAGRITGTVEEKDASAAQKAICEVNAGLLAAPARLLRRWLRAVDCANAAGEYYLPDVVRLAVADGVPVTSVEAPAEEVAGVNDRRQLAEAERRFQRRQAEALMVDGLQLLDPARFDLRGRLRFGRDVCIDVGCVLEGEIELGDDVRIGPGVMLRDVRIGAGTSVLAHSVLEEAIVGAECRIGPFARLRPDAQLSDQVHVGNFVEIKNSRLAAGAKANHLAYVGDADVGARVNIGAGVITCNYDGANKHRTTIGDDAFIGTDSQLVAPVTIGARAYVAAGSTIFRDAPADALTVCRAREQKSVPGWPRPVRK